MNFFWNTDLAYFVETQNPEKIPCQGKIFIVKSGYYFLGETKGYFYIPYFLN